MKVQFRLFIIIAFLGAAFLAGFWLLQQNQRSQTAVIASGRRAELEQLFQNILQLEDNELGTIVFDYTYWDELVNFVQTPDSNWGRTTLDSALSSYRINVIWVYNPALKQVYSTSNLNNAVAPPIPLSGEQIKALFTNSYLTKFSFHMPDGTVMEVQGATIHGSDDIAHQSPAQGYFFAGRVWSNERLKNISDLSGSAVHIINPQQLQDVDEANHILINVPITGTDGNKIAYIQGVFPNGYMQGFLQAQQHDLQVYGMITALLVLFTAAGLAFWVARPLVRISSSLAAGEPSAIQGYMKDPSEYGRIARLIQDFFNQRRSMAQQINLLENAEKALRESELRYRTITEIVSDATYSLIVHPDLTIAPEWGADSMKRVIGYPLEELVSKEKLLAILHPEDRGLLDLWANKMHAGKQVMGDFRIFTPDGKTRWIRNQIVPIMPENNERILRIFGAALDVTAQKQAEEAYRALVDNSLQGLAILQDWVLKFSNPAFCEMVGYTPEELLQLSESEIDSHLDPETAMQASVKMLDVIHQRVDSASFILRFQHKNGDWRWMDVACSLIEYQDRPAMQLITVDVTERISTEAALREQTDYSNILFNTINSLVVILTPEGKVTAFNPAAAQMAGSPQNAAHTSLWDFFQLPEDSPLNPENFKQAVCEKKDLDILDLKVQAQDGPHWLAWSQRYKTDAEGAIVYVIGAATDNSASKIRDRQREAIAGIATALRGNTTRRETIMTVLEKICDFMDADSAGVAFPVAEMDEILVEHVIGSLQPLLEGKRIAISSSILGEVLLNGKPFLAPDLQSEKKLAVPEVIDLVQSGVWVPLVAETKTIGVLFVAKRGSMSQNDLKLVQPVADLAAGAIDRAERTEQAQRRIQQLSALQSINLAIGASLDLRVTLNILAVQMTTQLGVDAVDVLQLNPNTKLLRFAAGNGFRSRDVEKLRLWLGEGQAGRAAMERRSRHLYDPDGIANYFTPPDLFKNENFVAYDAVPLVVKGEVKGVIEAYHRPPYNADSEWQQLLEALALETAIAIDNAELLEKLQRSNQDLMIAHDQTIEGWAKSLEQYDYETYDHSQNVVNLTVKLAQWVGISGENLRHIRRGALLHDIGKMAISRDILNKPGKLNEIEWEEMRKHPVYAYEILNPIPFLRPAIEIPYGHQERWDGTGYPQKLIGEKIPLSARIFAVVDIFDALISARSYKKAWPEEEALDYLKGTAGRELDPKLVRAFLEMYPIYQKSAKNYGSGGTNE
jgi:PAS domain S-box-containing protein/putative nucleotidyltransferase with HDIG domain